MVPSPPRGDRNVPWMRAMPWPGTSGPGRRWSARGWSAMTVMSLLGVGSDLVLLMTTPWPGVHDAAGVVSRPWVPPGPVAFGGRDRGGEMCSLPEPQPETDVASLIPMVRRIVGARVGNHPAAEDLVQETLVRVLAASARIDPGMLEPYAIVTARNVIASMWRQDDRHQRNQHRVVDLRQPGVPEERLLASEEQSAVAQALTRLSDPEREVLIAHEVSGQDTRSMAAERGTTAGAVAAQLNRTRARLRVEYLLVLERTEPPSDQCRPVLLALSSSDRRRQRELDAAGHLLDCELCARLSSRSSSAASNAMTRSVSRSEPTPTSSRPARPRVSWRHGSASPAPTSRSSPPRCPRSPATSCGSPEAVR